MKTLTTQTLLATGLIAATALAGGCSSTISSSDIRKDTSPERFSTTMTKEEFFNKRAIHYDNMMRQIPDDWAMIWLYERNLRLTRYSLD